MLLSELPIITSVSSVEIVTHAFLGQELIVLGVPALQQATLTYPWQEEEVAFQPVITHEETLLEIDGVHSHVPMTMAWVQRAKTQAMADKRQLQEVVVLATYETPLRRSLNAFKASTFRSDLTSVALNDLLIRK